MEDCAKDHRGNASSLEQHPKSHCQIKDKSKPMDDEEVSLLGG